MSEDLGVQSARQPENRTSARSHALEGHPGPTISRLNHSPALATARRPGSAPIHQLPVEVLRDIFVRLRMDQREMRARDSGYHWLSITAVCRHWHAIATEQCPELWSTIKIPTISSMTILQRHLTRSRNSLLSVALEKPAGDTVTPHDPSLHLLSTALAELHRVEELELSISSLEYKQLEGALRSPAPNLRSCRISMPLARPDDGSATPLAFVFDSQRTPKLRTLYISQFPDDVILWQGLRHMSRLKKLTVAAMRYRETIPYSKVLAGLGGMAALESLKVLGSQGWTTRGDVQNMFVLNMPKLQHMYFRMALGAASYLIRHLTLPPTAEIIVNEQYEPQPRSPEPDALEEMLGAHVSRCVLARPLRSLSLGRTSWLYIAAGTSMIPWNATPHESIRGRCFSVNTSARGPCMVRIDPAALLASFPLDTVEQVTIHVAESSDTEFLDAELASLSAAMPNVTEVRLVCGLYPPATYPDLSTRTGTSNTRSGAPSVIWPSLKTLVISGTFGSPETALLALRGALIRRETQGCTRLPRIVIADGTREELWKSILQGCAQEIIVL